jgi:hypothetical protein
MPACCPAAAAAGHPAAGRLRKVAAFAFIVRNGYRADAGK